MCVSPAIQHLAGAQFTRKIIEQLLAGTGSPDRHFKGILLTPIPGFDFAFGVDAVFQKHGEQNRFHELRNQCCSLPPEANQ